MSDVKKLKKKKVNKRKRRKTVALVVFLLFTFSLLIGLSLTVFFPVKSVKAQGSKFYQSDELIRFSEIKVGENLLRINKNTVLSNIQKNLPFVDDITIEKNLDGNIVIKVKEAKEVFVYNIGDKYYSTDKTGRVLKQYDNLPENILHIICESNLSEDNLSVVFEDAKKQEVIDKVSAKIEGFVLTANQLDITNAYEIKMVFDNRLEVNFGDISYFEEKLAHFVKMCENEKLENASGKINLSQYTPENPSAFFVKDEKQGKK